MRGKTIQRNVHLSTSKKILSLGRNWWFHPWCHNGRLEFENPEHPLDIGVWKKSQQNVESGLKPYLVNYTLMWSLIYSAFLQQLLTVLLSFIVHLDSTCRLQKFSMGSIHKELSFGRTRRESWALGELVLVLCILEQATTSTGPWFHQQACEEFSPKVHL